jgi:plastocyanin
VIAYPSGSYGDDKKDCIVAIYQDITVINVVVVDINVTIINGQTSTVTVTKTDEPAYTPPANPTYGAPIIQETHYVDVGGANLTFNPNQIRAKIGDVIKFKFLRLNHTLTQSEFNSPCTPNKLFDTGFNQFNNGTGMAKTIKLDVTTEAPQWFYCKQPQGNHCGKGMVFAINPDNMDQFIKNAIAQNGNTSLTATPIGTGYYPTGTGASYPTGTAKAMPTVIVGGGTSLTFTPPFLQNIKRGDKIFFDFLAKNHTLTESTFESPCSKRNGSDVVDTDFMNFNGADVPGAKPFTLEVKSDGERYFYCRQGGGTANSHCAAGMVFGINIDKNKFDKFQSAAKGTASTITTSSTVPTSSTAMTSSTVMTSSTAPTPSNVYKAPTPYKIKGRMVMP